MANQEHLDRLAEGAEAWNGWREEAERDPNLQEADLSQRDLRGYDLRGADLRGSDLREADLGPRDRDSADLREAKLDGADLTSVILRRADLREARLPGVELGDANLRGADLRDADLEDADLTGADIGKVGRKPADARRASFRGATLRDVFLDGANLADVDFHEADLRAAHLRKTDLTGAEMRRADLRGANLRHADLRGANLPQADLRGADLRSANLADALVLGVEFGPAEGGGGDPGRFLGVHAGSCHGSAAFRRYAKEQDYLEQLREERPFLYRLWSWTSDCGRSAGRWVVLAGAVAVAFSILYLSLGADAFRVERLAWGVGTSFYYSLATLATLSPADVVPVTDAARWWSLAEAAAGYLLLAGLAAILAGKMGRRA